MDFRTGDDRRTTPRTWSFVTPEYPPGSGGIGDYVELLARCLASRGDRVTVHAFAAGERAKTPGVEVELLPDEFGWGTRRALSTAWQALPDDAVVFVQYVPQGFGMKGMNVPFARWLGRQQRRVWLMFHEIVYPFVRGQPLRLDFLAGVTRVMLHQATRRAERAFVSTPAWEPILKHWMRDDLACEWLPIPATIDAGERAPVPESERPSVAHFGTYGDLVKRPLERILRALLGRNPALELVLVGRGSETFRAELCAAHPGAAERIRATGPAEPERVVDELRRAWVTVFPFLEGATTRRTSLMSALSAGAVAVTTDAWCTEWFWRRSGAVELVAPGEPLETVQMIEALLASGQRRDELRRRARRLYEERFDAGRLVERLRAMHSP
jgi:glycosyltransferase involved in cell wall biosynthesis